MDFPLLKNDTFLKLLKKLKKISFRILKDFRIVGIIVLEAVGESVFKILMDFAHSLSYLF